MVNDVRFADDQGMVAGTEMVLQRSMNKLNYTVKNFDTNLKLMFKKQ